MCPRRVIRVFTATFIGLFIILTLWSLLSDSARAMIADPYKGRVLNALPDPSIASGDPLSQTLFLPIVLRPHGSVYGYVTENGIPASGITVTLHFCRRYDLAPNLSTYCGDLQEFHTSTDVNGWYEFVDRPTLVISGSLNLTQTYQIYWRNDGAIPNRLRGWKSRILDSYSLGDQVNLSNFDVAGVTLISPISGTVTGFPVTFRWTPRAGVPSDSYALCLYGGLLPPPPMNGDMIGCEQPLGHTDHFDLVDPFVGIDYGYDYSWYVRVFSPDGGQDGLFYYTPIVYTWKIIFAHPQ